MRDHPEYIYAPLPDPSSSIRLLSVINASENTITCSLCIAPTLDSKPYHCLSYTWDDPFGRTDINPPLAQIICDGSVLTIRRNLYDALSHIYNIALQREKLTAIWVDAVCINQEDETEKGEQIKMMHKIYSGATSVVIWLGPDETNDAGSIRVVADAMRDQFGAEKLAKSASWDKFVRELHDSQVVESSNFPVIEKIDMDTWRAVTRTSAREYWQRLWVWKEVVASKNCPIIVSGHTVVSWEDMRLASHGQMIFGKSTLAGKLRPGMVTRNSPHQMAWWRDKYMEKGADWMQEKFGRLVLQLNRNAYVCRDERDKIFAHVGLCQRTKLAEWYKRPFEELYLHFWMDVIRRTNEVNFLTFVEDAEARNVRPKMQNDDRGVEFPSWVPDLRCCLKPASLWEAFQHVETFNVSKGLEARFPDGKEMESINGIEVDEDRKQLVMWAYRFDVVGCCGETGEEAKEQKAIPRLVALLADIGRTIGTTPYRSQDGADDAVATSLAILADTSTYPSYPVSEELKDRAKLWLFHALAESRISGHDNTYIQDQNRLLRAFPGTQGKELQSALDQYAQSHRRYLQDINSNLVSGDHGTNQADKCEVPASIFSQKPKAGSIGMAAMMTGDVGLQFMRLFLTKGGWIGKGPMSTKPGDEIWIVPGGEVPFVLRPKGKNFIYIGHCYVHGIMGGEAAGKICKVDMSQVVLE